MNDRPSRFVVAGSLLLFALFATASLQAGGPPARTGWAELSAVPPGTAIVVELGDGRWLECYFTGTTADQLIVLDLSALASNDRRLEVLDLLRKSPQGYLASVYVEEDGRRVPIVQRFERSAILSVTRPKPVPFRLNRTVSALLFNWSGPCPNCDAAQTWVGRKDTVVPSPLPARDAEPATRELLYLAPAAVPNPLDEVAWSQWRMLLPAGLKR